MAHRHVGPSQIRDRICVPCIGRWILNHWSIREAHENNLDLMEYLRGCQTYKRLTAKRRGVLSIVVKNTNELCRKLCPLVVQFRVTCVLSCFSCVNSFQPRGLQPTRLLCPWGSSGKNTGVGCRALIQGIFPTLGSNPCVLGLLHYRRILYH